MASYYSSDRLTHEIGPLAFDERKGDVDAYPAISPENQGLLKSDDWSVPFYNSPTTTGQIQGLIVGISGLNSHHMINPEELQHLNSQGFAAMWMGMPLHDRELGFMEPLTNIARLFLTNADSPANKWYSPHIPRYLLTHSTGGQIVFRLLNIPEVNKKLTATFSGAMHMAPYFDSAGASAECPDLVQKAWDFYTDFYKNKRPHEVFISRAYMKLRAGNEHFTRKSSGDDGPTHGQIREPQQTGRALMATFNKEAMQSIPHYFLFGENDPFACTKVGVKFAEAIGAEYEVVPGGGHDPIEGREDLREKYIGKIEECLKERRLMRAAFQNTLQQYRPARTAANLTPPHEIAGSGDRARFAL